MLPAGGGGGGKAETERKYVGISGKRIRCFTHALKKMALSSMIKNVFFTNFGKGKTLFNEFDKKVAYKR